jgi:signal transduction histidine kinase
VEFEDRHLCRDGSARWLEWTSRPVLEQGLVYAVARDVTDRKHIEAEQAALRRVTTLVARAVEPREIFAAVAREMRGLLEADGTRIERHELDGTTTVVASEGQAIEQLPAKIQAPITVEGREWGVTVAAWRRPEQSAAGTELRMAQFTELVAIAIANAESREQLIASRARIVATADDERRRIQRDLHDGAQQRVVTVAVKLKMHAASDAARTSGLDADLVELVHDVNDALRALRDIARGLHPPVLSRGGLPPALRDLAQRSPIPVALDVRVSGRLAKPIEVAAYYAVAEMLTNAAKHAAASRVEVTAEVLDGALRVCVRDDGVGGADQTRGSGLVGLRDRVDALGGTLTLDSPTGGGTTLVARLPLTAAADTAESTDAASTRQPRSAAR